MRHLRIAGRPLVSSDPDPIRQMPAEHPTASGPCVPAKKPSAGQIEAAPQTPTAWRQAKEQHDLSMTATEILTRHRIRNASQQDLIALPHLDRARHA